MQKQIFNNGETMKELTIEQIMGLSRKQFIDRCLEWVKEFNNGEPIDCDPLECPLHLYVVFNNLKCNRETVPNTENCPICGNPVCPDCMNHNAEQISRVTGYMSQVKGWNAAKAQEFKDRQRFNL